MSFMLTECSDSCGNFGVIRFLNKQAVNVDNLADVDFLNS